MMNDASLSSALKALLTRESCPFLRVLHRDICIWHSCFHAMRPTAKCHKNAQIMIQKNGENHTMIVHSATINCGNNVAAIRNQSKTRKPFKSGLFIFPDRTKSIKLINPCIFPGGWFFLRQIFTFHTSWGCLNKFSCLRFSYARELLPQHKQMICPVICLKLRRD